MTSFKKLCSLWLSLCLIASSAFSVAHAAWVPADALLAEARAEQLRGELRDRLSEAELQAQLQAWGVSPADAEQRLAHLSDAELLAFAEEVETLPAGGIAGAIGILFVVLLILELVGVIDIFKAI
jgi:hypothetical protein